MKFSVSTSMLKPGIFSAAHLRMSASTVKSGGMRSPVARCRLGADLALSAAKRSGVTPTESLSFRRLVESSGSFTVPGAKFAGGPCRFCRGAFSAGGADFAGVRPLSWPDGVDPCKICRVAFSAPPPCIFCRGGDCGYYPVAVASARPGVELDVKLAECGQLSDRGTHGPLLQLSLAPKLLDARPCRTAIRLRAIGNGQQHEACALAGLGVIPTPVADADRHGSPPSAVPVADYVRCDDSSRNQDRNANRNQDSVSESRRAKLCRSQCCVATGVGLTMKAWMRRWNRSWPKSGPSRCASSAATPRTSGTRKRSANGCLRCAGLASARPTSSAPSTMSSSLARSAAGPSRPRVRARTRNPPGPDLLRTCRSRPASPPRTARQTPPLAT